MARGEESWQGLEVTNKYCCLKHSQTNIIIPSLLIIFCDSFFVCDTFTCYIRLEEAVAGLKEGEAEVGGVLKKLEKGNEAVAALKNKVS